MPREPAHRARRKPGPGAGSRSRDRLAGRLLGEKGTLAGLASRALGWSFFSTAAGRLGQLGIGILLARLLGPHEFGTAAVAFVALLAILSFNELGVSLAIVRWPGEPAEIAPTVVTISVASSLLLYAGLFAAAPAFAAAMGAPAAAPVVRVLALSIVTDGVVAVPAALLERYFRQDRKMIADQVTGWLGAAVSVGLAWTGFGAMSLAVGSVAGALAGGIVIMIFAPLPLRPGFDRAKARKLMRFGLPLAGSSFIVFLVANVDNLVAGHVLGATALGFYVLAWNLSSWPVNMFSTPVRSVAPALFARLQHRPAAMRTSFVSAAALLGAATLPVCLLLSGSAVPLVSLVYGPRWEPAARALAWLALLGALRILFWLAYDYFVVLARSRAVFTVQLVWLLALIPSLIAGARLGGIAGVAIAGLAVAGCVVLPWYLTELSRAGIRARALGARLWLPLAAAAAAGAAARAAAKLIPGDLAACAAGAAAAVIATGLLSLRMRPVLAELRPALAGQDAPQPAPAGGNATAIAPVCADPARASADPGTSPHGPAGRETAVRALPAAAAPAPAVPGMTAPPSHPGLTGSLPVYQEVVALLRWDPAAAPHQSHRASPGRAESGEHGNFRHQPGASAVPARAGTSKPQVLADIDPASGDGQLLK